MTRGSLSFVLLALCVACARSETLEQTPISLPGTAQEADANASQSADAALTPRPDAMGDRPPDAGSRGDGAASLPDDNGTRDAGAGTLPPPALTSSPQVGGTGGAPFDDSPGIGPSATLRTIRIRSGKRVDRVELELRDGTVFSHGGSGGGEQALELLDGEIVSAVRICTGSFARATRVFYVQFTTNHGRSLAGGEQTRACTDLSTPPDRQVTGLIGRSGTEVDALGLLYTPLP